MHLQKTYVFQLHKDGYDMSTFIRRYARYLNEKAFAYRQMAFDFTRVKKGAEGVMRTMTTEKLLKGMPVLQTQIDTLLEFDVHPKELNNGIINAAFLLLFKDLVKLFASYNDGIINLLEKFFKMKKSDCKEALEIYKRFLTRVTKIGEFMKLAETVGVDKNDIPDINYAPSSILESLETHMNGLEDVKGGKKGSPTKGSPTNNVSPTSTPAKSSNAVPTLQPPPGDGAAAAAAPEPAEDSLLDLDPLSSTGPTAASAAPTSWGDLLGSDPFAPSDGKTNTASSGLDLFGMMTVENNSSLDVCFSSMETQPSPSPSPSPLFTSTSTTITITATISGSNINSTATDLFGADLFSSSAPVLSSAPPPKIDTGGIMSLFGAALTQKADYYPCLPSCCAGNG